MKPQLVLSLFPGIGLLDRAFEAEGFTVVRGPDVLWGGDIREFHPPAGKVDGVIGGPPCQMFSSLARLVRANGHEPRFGNLIPEFERCIVEAQPAWFVMENVPQAPAPIVAGYGIHSFELDNSMLDSGDGHGHEQRRVRRFSFGVRGTEAPNLMRWIDLATFVLPDAQRTLTQYQVNNSAEAKVRTRQRTVTKLGPDHLEKLAKTTQAARTLHEPITGGHDRPPGHRVRTSAVLGDKRETPVAIGGSGKVKPGASDRRSPTAVTGGHEDPNVSLTQARRTRKAAVVSEPAPPGDGFAHTAQGRSRKKAFCSSNGGAGKKSDGRITPGAGNNGRGRVRLADACRLQGLPEDFLDDAPFTADGKLKAVANGVPLPMGRAIAKAVREALSYSRSAAKKDAKRKRSKYGDVNHAYRCRDCGLFHLTTSAKR